MLWIMFPATSYIIHKTVIIKLVGFIIIDTIKKECASIILFTSTFSIFLISRYLLMSDILLISDILYSSSFLYKDY